MISTPSRGKFEDTCEQTSFRTGRILMFGRNLQERQLKCGYTGNTIELMSRKVFGSVYTQLVNARMPHKPGETGANLRNDLSQPITKNVSSLSFGNWETGGNLDIPG